MAQRAPIRDEVNLGISVVFVGPSFKLSKTQIIKLHMLENHPFKPCQRLAKLKFGKRG